LKINGLTLSNVTDFLSLNDIDVLTTEGKPEELIPLVKNLSQRNLLKRALVISRKTIETGSGLSVDKKAKEEEAAYRKLLSLGKDPLQIRNLRELIANEVGGKYSVYDFWVDIPDPPSFREAKQALIKTAGEDRIRLDKIFPVSKWLETYAENKWRGHVFCPPVRTIRKQVNKVAQKVLKEALDIKFNENATLYAKIE